MSLTNFPYHIPYILSFLISFSIGLITWQRRDVRGVKVYAFLAFSQCTFSFGYMMELGSPTLENKIFWDDFQWIGFIFWVVLFPIFTIQFTQYKRFNHKSTWALLSIVPIIFVLLLVTNQSHGLLHNQEYLIPGTPFNALRYDFTPAVWGFSLYGYLILTISFARLLINYFNTAPIYRAQVGAVVVGGGIPILATLLVLSGVEFGSQRDITPFTLAIGNLFIAWGLLRHRLFDVVPVAWDIVVQTMDDFVIVLDPSMRILGVNPITQKTFSPNDKSIVGKSAIKIFNPWLKQLSPLQNKNDGQVEIEGVLNGKTKVIDVHVTPLQDQDNKLLGKVYVARDITDQKRMEHQLRLLNSNLEELVTARTQELEDAYNSTLEGWAKALEIRDKETEGHSRRVTDLAVQMAQQLRMPAEEIEHLRRGALLHDIGKMAIPNEILHKPAALTPEERAIMQRHTIIAEELLAHIHFLKKALEIPRFHHERWDGQGYPNGLSGPEIPLSARIFTYIDNWDALLSNHPYRNAWSRQEALDYILSQTGAIFDPALADVFLSIVAPDKGTET